MHKHDTKTTPVFLPADGEASWLQLPSLVSLLSGATAQPENIYSSILNVTNHQRTTVYKYKLHRKPVMKQIQIDTHFHLPLILKLKNTFLFHVELNFLIKHL